MNAPLLREQDLAMWNAARPYLDVRNNDEHTLVAYGLAKVRSCYTMLGGKRLIRTCFCLRLGETQHEKTWSATMKFTALKSHVKLWLIMADQILMQRLFSPL